MKSSILLPLALTLGVAASAVSCGESGKPLPGNTDPCRTAVASVLGCPADSQLSMGAGGQAFGVVEACDKLVGCGQLAAEYLGQGGGECHNNSDCPGGECRPNSESQLHCYYHRLDYAWCIGKFSGPRTSRCDGEDRFSDDEVVDIVDCIARTPCATLGLPLAEKLASTPAEVDKFVCNDGKTNVYTATSCDHGLLDYR